MWRWIFSFWECLDLEQGACAADQPQLLGVGGHHDLVEAGDPAGEEVGQSQRWVGDAEEGVEVRPAEIGVHQHHPRAAPGEEDGEVGGDHRLADAPLAAADGPDAGPSRPLRVSAVAHRRVRPGTHRPAGPAIATC
jgi:hypothetical protein